MDTSKNIRYGKSKRVVSFSIPDGDREAHDAAKRIKKHCKDTGANFSYLMVKKLRELEKELGLDT